MRLIYIANARIPTEKAHGYQIMKMCESFAGRRFSVELIVPERKNKIKENPFVFYGLKENFKVRKIKCFDFIGAFPKGGRFSFWLQNVLFNFHLLFTKLEKDAVFYTRSASTVFILRLRGREVFFESHRLLNDRWIYRWLLGKKAKIISLTAQARNIYLQLGFKSENIIVAPDGVDLTLFGKKINKEKSRKENDLPLGKIIIGYFGRFKTMGEDKGFLDILRALSFLSDDILFLAVGGFPDEIEYYKKEAEKMGIIRKIIFKEAVARKNLPELEHTCDLLLMPFPWTMHFAYYMSPLKMFEYMASSRPIIATDLLSIREVLNEKNAVLIKPSNPNELAVAIKKLIENPILGEQIAQQAKIDVENYTWEKRAEKISQFIKSK